MGLWLLLLGHTYLEVERKRGRPKIRWRMKVEEDLIEKGWRREKALR